MTVRELSEGPARRKVDFDPLMSAHNMIAHNAMQHLGEIGVSPLSLFCRDSERPEMNCPICCLNWHSLNHDRICTTPNCQKPIGLQYDDWIDKAADGAAAYLKTLE